MWNCESLGASALGSTLSMTSVSNGSKCPGRFWFRSHPTLDHGNGYYPKKTRLVGNGPVLPTTTRHFSTTTLPPIKCLSSDRSVT